MTVRLDLAQEELEDALHDDVARKMAAFRASGQIGDLIRLRDARVHAGAKLLGASVPAMLQKPVPSPPHAIPEEEGGVPALDMDQLSVEAAQAALDECGVLLVRNVMPTHRTLQFRTMCEAAVGAGRALQQLEEDDMPDIRHTNRKEMLCRVKEDPSVLMRSAPAIFGDRRSFPTFMSPRIAFEWLDFLTARGFEKLIREMLQDHVRFAFFQCMVRRWRKDDPQPDWSLGQGAQKKGLLLWMPLLDCGDSTERPGIDVTLRGAPASGKRIKLITARPFLAAGDALLIRNTNVVSLATGREFKRKIVALETCFLPRSAAGPKDYPVLW